MYIFFIHTHTPEIVQQKSHWQRRDEDDDDMTKITEKWSCFGEVTFSQGTNKMHLIWPY